jgi:hypothetical protein
VVSAAISSSTGCSTIRRRSHDGHGEALNLQIDPRLVPHLLESVFPGAQTIETGAGISTIVLLILGAQHTSVSPDGGEADRIREYCSERSISTDGYTHIVGRSEDVLPGLHLPGQLDLAIVDGNHAFPAPFIDWFYLTRWLKPSGVLVVDDVELWTERCSPTSSTMRRVVWSHRPQPPFRCLSVAPRPGDRADEVGNISRTSLRTRSGHDRTGVRPVDVTHPGHRCRCA